MGRERQNIGKDINTIAMEVKPHTYENFALNAFVKTKSNDRNSRSFQPIKN